VRGTNGALYERRQQAPNGGWQNWASLGGEIIGDPVVIAAPDGRISIFARGSSALYQKRQSGANGGWSEWAFLDGGSLATWAGAEQR